MNRARVIFLGILMGMPMYEYGSLNNSSFEQSSDQCKPSGTILCNQIMVERIQAWMASIDYYNLIQLCDELESETLEEQNSGESLLECYRSQEEIDAINELLSVGVYRTTDSTTTHTLSGVPPDSVVVSRQGCVSKIALRNEDL